MGNCHRQRTLDNVIEPSDTTLEFDGFPKQPPIDKVWYGTKQKCPFMFYPHNNLWNEEFEIYCKNIIASVSELFDIELSKEIPNIIINGYLQTHIQRRWYPRTYILNSLPKQNSLLPINFNNARKSQSILNNVNGKNNIIEYLIEYFDLHLSLKQLNKTIINEIWETYFKKDDILFNEIVIYKEGDYFEKHIDSIYQRYDENNVIHKYDYTLIIIAPSNYKGGELIIYDKMHKNKNKQTVIGNNDNLWQWILFPKIREHECTKIWYGTKIAFKFHVASHSFASFDGYDMRYNVAYEPLATGFFGTGPNQRHNNPFMDNHLWSDSV